MGQLTDATVNAEAAPPTDEIVDQLKEIAYCTPGVGRTPSARFLTKFCKTLDEYGRVATIPAWPYVLEDCAAFESRRDIHDEKTRQMIATWLTSAQHLWRMMFVKNSAGFLTSRKEKLVDDGGIRSTPNSMMGRIRFIYHNLPQFLRDYAQLEFSKLRISCERTSSFTTGEGASGEGGRSGNYMYADVDEAAFIEGDSWFRAIRAACPSGLRTRSTPNGKQNIFARIKFDTPGDFLFLRKHWTRHPLRRQGLYYDEKGRPRSPWYDQATSSLTLDEVAREFDISYAHSAAGQVWAEFDEDAHLSWDAVLDTSIPLYCGMDFGVAAATAAVFFQVKGRKMIVLGDYEGWEGDADDHAPAIWAKAVALGFTGDKRDIRFYGDPAGDNRDQGNKNSTVMRSYRAKGFTTFAKAPRPPLKDSIRMVRRKFKRNEIVVHPQCSILRRRIPDFRWRTDVDGRIAGGETLIENSAKHICDALRFGALGVFPIEEDYTASSPRVQTSRATEVPVAMSTTIEILPQRSAFDTIASGRLRPDGRRREF